MSNLIYHYTSLNALYEIIKTKSLLLTSLHGMNDPCEESYKPETFISDIDLKQYPQKVDDNTKKFLSLLFNELNTNKKRFIENCKYKGDLYNFSFSGKADNMAHWERYADDMKGVCIAFSLDELEKLNSPLSNELLIRQIFYDDEERRRYICRSIVELYNELSKHIPNNERDNIINIFKKNCIPNLAGVYLSIYKFIKNDYWYDEDEVRLLYDEQSWKDTLNLINKLKEEGGVDLTEAYKTNHEYLGLDKTEYHCFSSIRPCKRLSLNQVWSDKLIPEIMLGCKSSQNIKDLELFICSKELENTKITESRIKIR